ncbi:D-alanyl-D-alanine carboxypeptidase/D-alanyl-D-alanine-endopeptidase [Sporosarcina limicola]|uniref:D-alanyl-D-alanine carboxypeptidase/D-alanyl-D-alanine-endopeptidase (Penicillin-binding protein 4) n=1 Tax=Sporosarcina limicola TaxID=34101 RepID=A0A927MEU1_9BACL|nr:D-alanyl-D-alanine carboxypeptidase/D-alanyl-D-alanine-endopeptidase [Sporosarcina limicola]MBE1553343.1 D-alanyl-D-alanine carboxypeptidase/D-alanyl-D-alanine-endopeptidase (penicillin-binding protein 4) [Sporosarcina limicola]
MKKFKLWKLMIVFTLITALIVLVIGKMQPSVSVTTSNVSTVQVTKINEPDELNKTVEFDGIDEILNDTRLQGATTGISIRKATTGEIIYARLGDTRLHPASVMKLLSGAAALETLGQDYRFKTELCIDGKIKNGVLHGNLYLRGQGDPTLTKKDLNAFASTLKAKGIQTVNGNIYGDDTWYDSIRLSQDLNWSDEPYYTGAQVSALTFSPNDDYDAGTVIVEVNPAKKSGQKGIVGMQPANSYVKIVNNTKTVAKDGKKSIQVERKHGSNTLIVSGTIPLMATTSRSWASVWEPTNYTVHLFKKAIDEQGIKFFATPKVERGMIPKGATRLTMKQSMPLKELFVPFMKFSNNGHAEVLVKEMGRVVGGEGSWDKGLAVMENTLADMGIDTERILLRDGSGMSHKNLVTANEVSKLLYTVQSKPWYPTFLNSLPVAGDNERLVGGTLRNRMKGTAAMGNVQAKTGALNGVTALSGYVKTKDGETLIFSIMVNNYLNDRTTEVLDNIAITLANYQSN